MDKSSHVPSGKPGDSAKAAIEAMPNLVKKITLMWNSRELDSFIQKAILDGRDGDRQGFPMEVGTELLFLAELNKLVRTFELAAKTGIKPSEAYLKIDAADREAVSPADSPWLDPLSVGSSRLSNVPPGGAAAPSLKPKEKKRSLLARIFSIR